MRVKKRKAKMKGEPSQEEKEMDNWDKKIKMNRSLRY